MKSSASVEPAVNQNLNASVVIPDEHCLQAIAALLALPSPETSISWALDVCDESCCVRVSTCERLKARTRENPQKEKEIKQENSTNSATDAWRVFVRGRQLHAPRCPRELC